MNAIEAAGVLVEERKTPILRRLNFQVRRGAITGLIGPSGAGKTTLMRCIVGVQEYNGTLHVLGQLAGSKSLRSKIGYVTQSPAIYYDLTVRQNIEYFARIANAPKQQVNDIIATVELGEQSNQIVTSLSGGQRARVSLAVALLGNPEILVLDEPTVGLDPILRQQLWNVFRKLADAGKTVLVSSHVMDEADRCDEVLLVRDGQILWNDTREKLLTKTRTSSTGDAFITMIEGEPK